MVGVDPGVRNVIKYDSSNGTRGSLTSKALAQGSHAHESRVVQAKRSRRRFADLPILRPRPQVDGPPAEAQRGQAAAELHKLVLPEDKAGATQELVAYLLDSFGNPVRIDYGTGHELHFIIWMYCLHALGLVQQEHLAALVTRVFARYLTLGTPRYSTPLYTTYVSDVGRAGSA